MFGKKNISRILPVLAILFASFFLGSCSRKAGETSDFNIVLIVIDTLRSDHLPFYGYEKNTAPFLWDLSKKSVVFENAFSASSWTSPATASIFTSLYPYQHGVLMGLLAIRNAQKIDPDIKVHRIPEEITTIAELLKEQGYRTYGVSDNLNIGERQGFTQGFDRFRTFMYKQAPNLNQVVKGWKTKLTAKGKYFLYLHYMEPHAPYHPRKPWYKPYEDKRKNRISAYDSEINFVDLHIKKLFELFKWEKNTLVIVTADHGEGLWDHGLMAHGKTLHREEIQVPLMIYLPGKKIAKRVTANVGTIDILPTVRDLVGLPADKNAEGISLAPLLAQRENKDREKRFNELAKRNLFSYLWVKTKDELEWKSAIYKKWHFIIKMPALKHLYSLLLDKKEQENRIAEAHSAARELEQRFEHFMKTCKKYKQKSAVYKLDKKKTDKLKSLGYVD